jgi:hypothetical protein
LGEALVIASLRTAWDTFRGSGTMALTVPPMDGAFRPNTTIETASIVATAGEPDNLVVAGGDLFYSDGAQVLRLNREGKSESVAVFSDKVTALAGAPEGTVAVATRGATISFVGRQQGSARAPTIEAGQGDITAMSFIADNKLAATVGSLVNPSSNWRQDLMQLRRTGSVWIGDLASGVASKIVDGLGYPSGVIGDAAGHLIIAEAWQHRLVRVSAGTSPLVLVDNLPAYPGRLFKSARGGFWLGLFAPRNQLVEFVLREPVYRGRMVREIAQDYWICPSFESPESPLGPMQEGGQKIGGAIKPWAPSFSYGLIARLDRDCQPQFSFHSRANGRRHGITSIAEYDDRLFATSAGAGLILEMAVS